MSTLINCQYDGAWRTSGWLSAAEATARLGVKPQTLYAYVSRGLIRRERLPGTRTSRYSRSDVEGLAGHSRSRPARSEPEIHVDQAITALDPAGHLSYRGWDATRAAVDAHYEQVAAWLWGTTFGPNDHWSADAAGLATARRVQAALPASTPLPDRLRVVVAALRPGDPLRDDRRVASVAARSGTLLATVVKALPPVDARDDPGTTGSLARRLWTRVSPLEPTTRRVRALDRALSLLADHELATSTLAVRVAASVWADPYLLLLTGLATTGGPLHGGASEFVRTLLRDAARQPIRSTQSDGRCATTSSCPASVTRSTRVPIHARRCCSTRSTRLRPPRELWRAAQGVLDVMARAGGPYPNIDFALGVLGEAMRMVARARANDVRRRPQRGLDRPWPRGVPAPAPLPHPRHLHRPGRDGLAGAARCWRRWSRKSTST